MFRLFFDVISRNSIPLARRQIIQEKEAVSVCRDFSRFLFRQQLYPLPSCSFRTFPTILVFSSEAWLESERSSPPRQSVCSPSSTCAAVAEMDRLCRDHHVDFGIGERKNSATALYLRFVASVKLCYRRVKTVSFVLENSLMR